MVLVVGKKGRIHRKQRDVCATRVSIVMPRTLGTPLHERPVYQELDHSAGFSS